MPPRNSHRLPRSFYSRPTLQVSEELIGKQIVYRSSKELLSARIVEVEAYIGEDDPASHAAPGPTKRNVLMYGKPGVAYIYFIYGMYYCLNFVTERKGFPAAILLRAAEPIQGIETLSRRNPRVPTSRLLSGPGKFCRGFGLTLAQNGMDLTGSELFLEDRGGVTPVVARSTRIGIRKGADKGWRFFDADSAAVSGSRGKVAGRVAAREVQHGGGEVTHNARRKVAPR